MAPCSTACSMSSSQSKTFAGPENATPSLPVIFATALPGARLPRSTWMWPLGWIGSSHGFNTCWPSRRPGSDATFSASVRPVTVRQSPCSAPRSSSSFTRAGVPPASCRSSITKRPARLQVREVGCAVAHGLEVVDAEIHARRPRHGDQVQHRVRRSAEDHDHHHCVLEGLARHDLARLDVALEQHAQRRARTQALLALAGILGRRGRAAGQRSCPAPRWPWPWCWRCTCRRTRPRRDTRGAR